MICPKYSQRRKQAKTHNNRFHNFFINYNLLQQSIYILLSITKWWCVCSDRPGSQRASSVGTVPGVRVGEGGPGQRGGDGVLSEAATTGCT